MSGCAYPTPLEDATLLRRYKRFLADVRWPDGRVETVHCPNPGAMTGCAPAQAPCRVSRSDNPRRKLPCTLEQVWVGSTWVHVNPVRSNLVIRWGLEQGRLPWLGDWQELRAEAPFPSGGRCDFQLRDPEVIWLEVKSTTWAVDGVGRFPDAQTARGRRHLQRLMEVRVAGDRAALLFLVARADVRAIAPADSVDPEYGALLRKARAAGVELYALRCAVGEAALGLAGSLPVQL